MKKFLKIGLLLLAFVMISMDADAQKFGYINSTTLLEGMPEVTQMRSKLQDLGTMLQKQGEQMLKDYQAREKEAVEKKQLGQMTPLEEQNVMKELEAKQQEILAFEQNMQKQLLEKEQALLQPIIDEVNTAIKNVATENGYQYIFDARPDLGVILYAEESQDVTALVKAKLGMP